MPSVSFEIVGVEAIRRGLTPLLEFRVIVNNSSTEDVIESILLHAQIQIQSVQRSYSEVEKRELVELFGVPEDWGHTLRNRFWMHTQTIVPSFRGSTEVRLPAPCTYDLNVAATKYFYALKEGGVELLFLFSGTVFYIPEGGNLQVQRISWEKEATFRMTVQLWCAMMDYHYPDSAWLYLPRHVFDRLYAFKRSHGISTWEQTVERLLLPVEHEGVNT